VVHFVILAWFTIVPLIPVTTGGLATVQLPYSNVFDVVHDAQDVNES